MAYKFQIGPAVLSGALTQEGNIVADNANVSAVDLSASGDVFAGGEATLASAIVSDLTQGRITLAGAGGALEDSADLAFDASGPAGANMLAIGGYVSASQDVIAAGGMAMGGNADVGGDLTVSGQSTLQAVDAASLTATGAVVAAALSGNLEYKLSAGDGIAAFDWRNDANATVALTASVAGDGLGYAAGVLAVQVDDSSLEIVGDALQVKAAGITNDMISGSIASSKIDELNAFDTADLAEGTNLYYTDARARAALSVSVSDDSKVSLSYDSGSGVFTFNGVTAAEIRQELSVVASDDSKASLSYDSGSGVFTFNGVTAAEIREEISLSASAGMSSLSYDSGSGQFAFAPVVEQDVRDLFSVVDTNSMDMAYNSATGEFKADLLLSGSTSFEIDAGGLKLKSSVAGNGLNLSADGELSVNASALALTVATITADGQTIGGAVDLQLVNIAAGGTATMPSPTSGKLLRVKRTGGGNVTLSGTFSDGSPVVLEADGAAIACIGDGSSWHIV